MAGLLRFLTLVTREVHHLGYSSGVYSKLRCPASQGPALVATLLMGSNYGTPTRPERK